MGKIISLNPEINCLVARAVVNRDLFEKGFLKKGTNAVVDKGRRYKVFFRGNNDTFVTSFDEVKDKSPIVELYWICENGVEIKVPWGIPKTDDSYGINGELIFNVDEKIGIESIMRMYASDVSAWQVEVRDDIRYEYLSEYFINSNGLQSGLSIILKDKVKQAIEANLKRDKIDVGKINDELRGKIKSAIESLKSDFNSIGLKLNESSLEQFTIFKSRNTES